ncbi:hypothetical protein VUR80DRAFT_7166 [Thermomyces stellatus]
MLLPSLFFHTSNSKKHNRFFLLLPHHARSELFSALIDRAISQPFPTRLVTLVYLFLTLLVVGCIPPASPLTSLISEPSRSVIPDSSHSIASITKVPPTPTRRQAIIYQSTRRGLVCLHHRLAFPICSKECGEVTDTSPDELSWGSQRVHRRLSRCPVFVPRLLVVVQGPHILPPSLRS